MLEVYFWVNKRYKNTYSDNLSCFESPKFYQLVYTIKTKFLQSNITI